MKLNKTNKKIDNNICKALTIACEYLKDEVPGFNWLTHRVNYSNYPASLLITCVFETEIDIEKMKFQLLDKRLRNEIQKQLLKVGVVVKNISQQVHFDTEEACLSQSGGDWSHRLAQNIVMQKAKPTVRSKRQH